VTPGNEGSERSAMTATRLGRLGAPEATGLPLDQPLVVARSRSPALAVRFGLAGVAVTSAIVGWVLFGDTDRSLWWGDYWPVRELMAPAIAFSLGGAVLLGYRKARWPAGALLICGLLAGIALLFAGLWWDGMLKHGGSMPTPLYIANGVTTGLFMGLSLAILPQLYPDGPLPGRIWKVLLGVTAVLVVVAPLHYAYNFPTIDDQAEWRFWSTVVGLAWLIALASLFVRWRRGSRLLRRQIVPFATVTMIMIAVTFLSPDYTYFSDSPAFPGLLPYLRPAMTFLRCGLLQS
jgi:hypothetical protein